MCGIAGKIWFDETRPVERHEITRMIDAMRHRGPDGDGIHLEEAVGLGHLGLSIIDLIPPAHNRCATKIETIWIVFNGEIYNYWN